MFSGVPHVAPSHVAPINGYGSHRIRQARRTLHKHQMDSHMGAPNNAAVKTKTDQFMDQWTACGPDFHCIDSTQQPIAHRAFGNLCKSVIKHIGSQRSCESVIRHTGTQRFNKSVIRCGRSQGSCESVTRWARSQMCCQSVIRCVRSQRSTLQQLNPLNQQTQGSATD